MPTCPPPRSTPSSPPNTCARSTKAPTPELDSNRPSIPDRRAAGPIIGAAALLLLTLLLAACDDEEAPTPPPATPTGAVSATPTASASLPGGTAPPARDLVGLARRLRGLTGEVDLEAPPPPPPAVGHHRPFNVLRLPRPGLARQRPARMETIEATLRL